ASDWAPTPAVLAGKALIDLAITASISAGVMVWAAGAAAAVAVDATPAPATMCKVAFMPACSCPATWQYMVYVPADRPPRSRLPVPPGSIIGVASDVSLTARLWAMAPMFMIWRVPPAATVTAAGSIFSSLRWTIAVVGAPAAAAAVPAPDDDRMRLASETDRAARPTPITLARSATAEKMKMNSVHASRV